jgi:D-alanine-D-alanine ligase
MAEPRPRVAIVFGGRSGEHEVSIQSARSVIAAIDPSRYEVVPVGITHQGAWVVAQPEALLTGRVDPGARVLPSAEPGQPGLVPATPSPGVDGLREGIDVVFPLVHGTYGEDGCLQGLFELAGIPFVGSGVLASSTGMDKIVMKKVFRADGLPVVDYVSVARADWGRDPEAELARVKKSIGFPCFVKPADLGSSVGINKVRVADELPAAIDAAAEFSGRIIVERGVDARELECGVLGNHNPAASVVGEIIPARDFYDYEAKYVDPNTQFLIPADLDPSTASSIRDLAIRAFTSIGASGMARVDFFLERTTGEVFVNEINTIPGFTAMSVYPRLWEASGVPYTELIHRLIQLAVERHADRARNRTHYLS